LARLIVMPPFDAEFFAGRDRLAVEADSLFDLVAALDAQAPGFAAIAQPRATFAVDGVVAPDWATPITPDSEVILLPRVGGGWG